MRKTRVEEWPLVRVRLHPDMKERIEDQADERGLSASALIREALAQAYGPRPRILSDLR